MRDETREWVRYADENLEVARLSMKHGYLNACLQNGQQAAEKYLKALIIERNLPFRKTHNMIELHALLAGAGIAADLSAEDCVFLDAVYLPSKYPTGNILAEIVPATDTCRKCLEIVEHVRLSVLRLVEK